VKLPRPGLHRAALGYMAFITVVFLLLLAPVVWAETATVDVVHLPLAEAASSARSQLSAEGRIVQLPSRRLLIITDEAESIERARELLSKLDVAPAQLAIQVVLSEQSKLDSSRVEISQIVLPGGWVRLVAAADSKRGDQKRNFMLRTSSGVAGHIEAGEIRVAGQRVREYLTVHGMVSESRLELIHVTGGFDVQATLLGAETARLVIHPWLRNATQKDRRIKVAQAATELTVKLDETVTLAASRGEAEEFSTALFGIGSLNSKNQLNINVRVSRAGM